MKIIITFIDGSTLDVEIKYSEVGLLSYFEDKFIEAIHDSIGTIFINTNNIKFINKAKE